MQQIIYLKKKSKEEKTCFSEQSGSLPKLDFEVNDFFMFGSPLALVLAYRKIASSDKTSNYLNKILYH